MAVFGFDSRFSNKRFESRLGQRFFEKLSLRSSVVVFSSMLFRLDENAGLS